MNYKIVSIVVCFNGMTSNHIGQCLWSLQDSILGSKIDHEIIVVDNASEDDSRSFIRNNFSDIILIENDENYGFAKGNNIGITKAIERNGDFFFLVNQDVRVQNDTLKDLVSLQSKNCEYGILTPIHLNGDGALLDFNFCNYISNSRDEGRKLYTDLLLKRSVLDLYSISFCNAAAWMLSRDTIDKIGLFNDVLFPHYGEDNDYLNRLFSVDLKLGVTPNAFIYHDRESRKGQVNETGSFRTDHHLVSYKISANNPLLSESDKKKKLLTSMRSTQKKAFFSLVQLRFDKYKVYRKQYLEKKKVFDSVINRNDKF